MGKLDVKQLRYLTTEDFRVLTAIEMGMKNHELVPKELIASIAKLHGGGVYKILMELSRNRLIYYERGKKYDGYRLNYYGYDFLALRTMAYRQVIAKFGNEIGKGKESTIYSAVDEQGKVVCVKLHNLGKTSFRKVREKRDYHKHRRHISWLYLSHLAAVKEFAFMKALHKRGFPVPEPIDINRNCVVMGLIKGDTLCDVRSVDDVSGLYDRLMQLIVEFGNHGVIHSDFNEFNIMLEEETGQPIIIDLPQMVSISHKDAEMYFDRDVTCVREFFRKRFKYESEDFPTFADVVREDNMDVEVAASGFTKKMNSELQRFQVVENHNSSEDVSEEEETSEDEEDDEIEEVNENAENFNENAEKVNENAEKVDENVEKDEEKSVEEEETEVSEDEDKEKKSSDRKYVRAKLKKELRKKLKQQRRNLRVKGEASSINRKRRDNDLAVQKNGFWGWG
ncbi:hypothetical protein CHUAL_000168 [Chamberlinius hualienensis]